MADTLHFGLPQDRLHPAFNALDQTLASRGEDAQGTDGGKFRLNIVNAIWGERTYTFLDAFLDALAENYGAGMRVLDFMTEPEPSRLVINEWVSDQTEEKIQNLIPQGMVTSLTRLVLTNAVYFNAAWARPFNEAATSDGAFSRLDGSQVTVPMMTQELVLAYHRGTDFTAVEMPYDGNELSMLLLLPDTGSFTTFEASLSSGMFNTILAESQANNVSLIMPRFEFRTDLSLTQTLSDLGMPIAFAPGAADLSGMDGTLNLFISAVLHKAYIKVNEQGTEAAAATAVIVGETSVPPDPIVVTLDRPFVFLIRDIETGTILFLGRVLDPAR